MNPLDLHGPQFLAFYADLFLTAVAFAALLRWYLRQPSDDPPSDALDLSPYETAYLQGSDELTVNAAIARLVHENVLAVNSGNRTLTLSGDGLPTDASGLERAVYSTVRVASGVTIAAARAAVASHLEPMKQRLQDLGLLVEGGQAGIARWFPLFLVLLVPLLGAANTFVGLSRNRPVSFLVIACSVSALVAFCFYRSVHRSRRGDHVLAQLKANNAALEYQAGRRLQELSGNDLVLALGLFGLGILASGPMANLHTALMPPPGRSGCGGGGCGGGGCGGCGG